MPQQVDKEGTERSGTQADRRRSRRSNRSDPLPVNFVSSIPISVSHSAAHHPVHCFLRSFVFRVFPACFVDSRCTTKEMTHVSRSDRVDHLFSATLVLNASLVLRADVAGWQNTSSGWPVTGASTAG